MGFNIWDEEDISRGLQMEETATTTGPEGLPDMVEQEVVGTTPNRVSGANLRGGEISRTDSRATMYMASNSRAMVGDSLHRVHKAGCNPTSEEGTLSILVDWARCLWVHHKLHNKTFKIMRRVTTRTE